MKPLYSIISFILIIICTTVLPVAATDAEINILATNSWTAAFVKMAGAEADALAPSNIKHPPEYELKPSDVKKIYEADLIVYAGYEAFMKIILERFHKPEDQMIKITTSYDPEVLEKSVISIAKRLGTEEKAKLNIVTYKNDITAAKIKLRKLGFWRAPVLVHYRQKTLIQLLGFKIIGIFGPQPLEVKQIFEMGKLSPRMIIDNAHNPIAAPLEEIHKMKAVKLVNFPGFCSEDGTICPDSLLGVMKSNIDKVLTF